MKCRDVKRELALLVGHDATDPFRREEIRRHVAACPGCRTHFAKLRETFVLFEQADPPATYETRGSLWPALESRLDAPQPAKPRRSGDWIPLASMALACLLFVGVWVNVQAPTNPRPASPPIGRQTVSPLADWPRPEKKLSKEAREADRRAHAVKVQWHEAEPKPPVLH